MAVVELSTTYAQACMLGGERESMKERECIESKCQPSHQPCLALAEPAQQALQAGARCLNSKHCRWVSHHPRVIKLLVSVSVYLYLHKFDSGGGLSRAFTLKQRCDENHTP